MTADKSLFYYGWWFHKLFDNALDEGRRHVLELVEDGSTVLDLGCGTGQLSAALHASKHCHVTGLDLSTRMLDFARRSSHDDGITFVHHDATDLGDYGNGSFDVAAVVFILHELPTHLRKRLVTEAFRVARRVIMVDATAPLPHNLEAGVIRAVEATFGHDHHQNFRDYLARGGIPGLLADLPSRVEVAHRTVFEHGCRQLVAASAVGSD